MTGEVQTYLRPLCVSRETSWNFNGRGERIRTSGPCLPNALPLHSRECFPWLALTGQRRLIAFVPARFTVGGSIRTLSPCAYPCGHTTPSQTVMQERKNCEQ